MIGSLKFIALIEWLNRKLKIYVISFEMFRLQFNFDLGRFVPLKHFLRQPPGIQLTYLNIRRLADSIAAVVGQSRYLCAVFSQAVVSEWSHQESLERSDVCDITSGN